MDRSNLIHLLERVRELLRSLEPKNDDGLLYLWLEVDQAIEQLRSGRE